MSHPWSRRRLALAVVLAVVPAAAAFDWDPGRVTSPQSVGEMRGLQDRVTRVVERCTAATVGLVFRADGGKVGAGSGVIVRDDGLVLTAGHVILDGETGKPLPEVTVVLADGTAVPGKPLGVNVKADSGMVRLVGRPPAGAPGVQGGKWPVAGLGRAADLAKGQWVVSLGHPGGPKQDRRPAVRLGRYQGGAVADATVVTDCTLVGGDSGGPLFDLAGNVVGIHSRIGRLLQANVHVPAEAFRTDWDRLLKGEVLGTQPDLPDFGVTLDEHADDARVAAVTAGGPADKAGLKPGDVVTRFDGSPVGAPDELLDLLDGKAPGDRVAVEVQRGDRTLNLAVTLGRKPRRNK